MPSARGPWFAPEPGGARGSAVSDNLTRWQPGEPCEAPSPALTGTLSPFLWGEGRGEGLTLIPWPLPPKRRIQEFRVYGCFYALSAPHPSGGGIKTHPPGSTGRAEYCLLRLEDLS